VKGSGQTGVMTIPNMERELLENYDENPSPLRGMKQSFAVKLCGLLFI